MIITPKQVISIVLENKTKNSHFHFYDTKFQKWMFFLATGFSIFGASVAALTYIWNNGYIALTALVSLLIGVVFTGGYQLAAAIPEFGKLRNIEKEISSPLLLEFDNDLDLINNLCDFEVHHLEYARNNYARMAKQLRERLGLLVGAIDKVGVIPVAVTAYMAYLKAMKEKLLSFGGLEWLAISFLFLYLLAIRMSTVAQWMEKIEEIYESAINLKKARTPHIKKS